MRKIITIIVFALLPLCLYAQEQKENAAAPESSQEEQKEKKPKKKASEVITGFTGGVLLHVGYLFSDDPRKVFSNSGLGTAGYVPANGFCYGLGGMLRMHMLNHIHLGVEGVISTSPMMTTGSNVRTGWGGVSCDAYTDWGSVRPMIGLMIGGGSMSRLYVPATPQTNWETSEDKINYNASFAKTPFFLIDPYIGLEIGLKSQLALMLRIDYMLPFGRSTSNLVTSTADVNWSNFLTPHGPRLYIGLVFGNFKRKANNG